MPGHNIPYIALLVKVLIFLIKAYEVQIVYDMGN